MDTQPQFSDKPWLWILIPAAIVASIGMLAVSFQLRRRRRLKQNLMLDRRGRRALERDIEAAALPPSGPAAARWAWANNLNLNLNLNLGLSTAGGPRREDGLNELGEPPPPYAPAAGPAKEGRAECASGPSPTGTAGPTEPAAGRRARSPPAYSELGQWPGGADGPAPRPPPPAVLPGFRRQD